MYQFIVNRSETQKRVMAIVLAVLLALTIGMTVYSGPQSYAADDDPNMTAYEGRFTVDVPIEEIAWGAELRVVPADSNYIPTSFSTAAGAAGVIWDIAGETGGLSGLTFSPPADESIPAGGFYSNLHVNIPAGVTPGAASFIAINRDSAPNANASVNITLLVNDDSNNDDSGTEISGTVFQVFEPNESGVTILHSGTLPDVDAAMNTDSRSYVTVLDSVGVATGAGIINNYAETGGYLSSMTVNGNTYSASGNDGWQYAVYDLSSDGQTYTLDTVTSVLGAGDYGLTTGQLVQWRYGAYGLAFPKSFPNPEYY